MKKRRGQSDPAAIATFILLLALFILVYVLIVAPEERERILGESFTSANRTGTTFGVTPSGKTLLSVSPGMVFARSADAVPVRLNPLSLFVREEQGRTTLANTLLIRKSLFSNNPKKIFFTLSDAQKASDANLFFFISEGSGGISVKLNNNVVFEGDIRQRNLPITLPGTFLQNQNQIEFELLKSSFFGNQYSLTNLELRKTTSLENRKATRVIELTAAERTGLQRANLFYFVNCRSLAEGEEGSIKVTINGRAIHDDHVFCDAGEQRIEISKTFFEAGTNRIEFNIDKGDYVIDNIELLLDLATPFFPKYNFEINDETFFGIVDQCREDCIDNCNLDCNTGACFNTCLNYCLDTCDARGIVLALRFAENKRHKASIAINEFEVQFDTNERTYNVDITDFVLRGSNFIKIVPKADFEIEDLRVFVE